MSFAKGHMADTLFHPVKVYCYWTILLIFTVLFSCFYNLVIVMNEDFKT